jgi:hypothetical protein
MSNSGIIFVDIPGSKSPRLSAAIVHFDAELAHEWLSSKNKRNRPLSRAQAKKYAVAMLGEEWQLNGEAIILDENENLVNGQHRLDAVIQAAAALELDGGSGDAISVPMLVIRGVKPTAFDTFDQGRPRTLADVLAVNEEDLAVDLAGALRLLWLRLQGGKIAGGKAFRHLPAVKLLDEHPGLSESVGFFRGNGKDRQGLEKETRENPDCDARLSRIVGSLAHAACLHYLMSNASPEDTELPTKVTSFWYGLAFGVDDDGKTPLPADDPRKRCRTVLLKSANSESKLTRDAKIGVIVKAWNAFYAEETLSRLSVAKGEYPRIGGIDTSVEEDAATEVEPVAPPAPKKKATKPRKSKKAAPAKEEEVGDAFENEDMEENMEEELDVV